MGANPFDINPRKRRTSPKCEDSPSELEFLKLKVDSRALLRGNAAKSSARPQGEVPSNFQTLLSESNREFARLLRDVRSKANGRQFGDTPNQWMSDLLMR